MRPKRASSSRNGCRSEKEAAIRSAWAVRNALHSWSFFSNLPPASSPHHQRAGANTGSRKRFLAAESGDGSVDPSGRVHSSEAGLIPVDEMGARYDTEAINRGREMDRGSG